MLGPWGFTLLEVVLALTVVTLLLGVGGYALSGGVRPRFLDEGTDRFATALRMARAEAANRGLTLRLRFTEDGRCVLEHEAAPLVEPGLYAPYDRPWIQTLHEAVRVVSSEVDAVDAYVPREAVAMTNDPGPRGLRLDPIHFYPDGSSDRAVVELCNAQDPSDSRRGVVTIRGLSAAVTGEVLTASQLAEREDPRE